ADIRINGHCWKHWRRHPAFRDSLRPRHDVHYRDLRRRVDGHDPPLRDRLFDVGLANSGRSPLPRLDTSLGVRWSFQSPHTRIPEAIAGGSTSSIHSMGYRWIRHQCDYRFSFLPGDAGLLHPERRVSAEVAHHIARRNDVIGLLLHECVPLIGTSWTWRGRAAIREVHCGKFDRFMDCRDCSWAVYTVRRSDLRN